MRCEVNCTVGLLDLAQEVIEEVLCHVDSPQDLIAFALASHLCASIAIPRHTEYRVLHITKQRPHVWKHLALYPNLASNIREVHIDFRNDTLDGHDKYPVTLVDPALEDSSGTSEQDVIEDMCKGLAAMKRLTMMTWRSRSAPWTIDLDQAIPIIEALAKLPTLQRLSLDWLRGLQEGHDLNTHPTWDISNLTHLRFQGFPPTTSGSAANIIKMLQKSPNLVHLHARASILSCVAAFSGFVLPMLTTLSLYGNSRDSIPIFIQRHPTIEELRWDATYHPFLPGSLPNCKRLRVSAFVRDALHSCCHLPGGPSRRQIEVIQLEDADTHVAYSNRFLDPTSLIVLRTHQDLAEISTYATRFPMIRWLEIIPKERTHKWTMDEWIEALSQFTRLETIGESNIWDLVLTGEVTASELIQRLVRACPHLHYLNNFDKNQGEGHRLAVHHHAGDDPNESIDSHSPCYMVQKRRTRSRQALVFEPMEGAYDNSGYVQPPRHLWHTIQLHPHVQQLEVRNS
ncbi:hypothetical protein BDN72DRAFT_899994 [Pluteus cervinus]|uniref:Uncharacterized protein n=1 Tax=Pluteus cervinus TaxID=181527 RepID=A0ACD3ALW0_9AGAR|nr:hypothetical protein BDN72DRAFT_899994 [Pluteus cervinus]